MQKKKILLTAVFRWVGRIIFLQKQFSTYKEPEEELEAITIKEKHEMNRLINNKGKVSSVQRKMVIFSFVIFFDTG